MSRSMTKASAWRTLMESLKHFLRELVRKAGNDEGRTYGIEIIHECSEALELLVCGTKVIGESTMFVALVTFSSSLHFLSKDILLCDQFLRLPQLHQEYSLGLSLHHSKSASTSLPKVYRNISWTMIPISLLFQGKPAENQPWQTSRQFLLW